MFRESLAPGRGMLFLFPSPSVEGFWMKNCNFPIDIVWMDPDRKVIYVNAHTPPCKDDPCPTYGPKEKSLFVLEIPDGAAAKEKIAPGAVLTFENVPRRRRSRGLELLARRQLEFFEEIDRGGAAKSPHERDRAFTRVADVVRWSKKYVRGRSLIIFRSSADAEKDV